MIMKERSVERTERLFWDVWPVDSTGKIKQWIPLRNIVAQKIKENKIAQLPCIKNPAVLLRLLLKKSYSLADFRHIEFLGDIGFWNQSGLLVAEYDSIMVTKKHHTLYNDQKYFNFALDFRGTFDTDLEDCPNMVRLKDAFI